jgi:protein-disulfide isomerase
MNIRQRAQGLAGLTAAGLLVLAGCQGSGAVAQMNERLASIQDNQSQIIKKLEELEGKVGRVAAAAPAPRGADQPQKPQQPQAGKPDPNATYKVAVGDAHFKGPADAKITIVEWSDFQ